MKLAILTAATAFDALVFSAPAPASSSALAPRHPPHRRSYGIKKGFAYNDGGAASILASYSGKRSWAYNWGAAPNAPNYQQIPMHWAPTATATRTPSGPCSRATGLGSWGGAKLVCPAISSWDTGRGFTGGPSGFTWLRQFVWGDPGRLRCDAQALDWHGVYGRSGAHQAKLFMDYIGYAHEVVNNVFDRDMDLWITEFSPGPSGTLT
ncbi:hypothetical protein B0H63DRAFT_556462 [Podospora didyma]|uniref:Asl1-like glycosyl hydrolase catalytic domain-containing protein n=1 Tax=Podospora didyma TaxID=330526 RepID=A0AAE0NXJ5_9PEZI|nr:hypothetical protein B0H63DRAFT_556462 [Podospora didyma]